MLLNYENEMEAISLQTVDWSCSGTLDCLRKTY